MEGEHKGFQVKVRHLATFYEDYSVVPGGTMTLCWDGKALAECDVTFHGTWRAVECYCEVDGFSGYDLDRKHYIFRCWNENERRLMELEGVDLEQGIKDEK